MTNAMWEYLFQVSVWLSCVFSVYHFFLKKDTHFQRNRIFLLGGTLFSLLFPLSDALSMLGGANVVSLQREYALPILYMDGSVLQGQSLWGFITLNGLMEFGFWSLVSFFLIGIFVQIYVVCKVALRSEKEKKKGYTLVLTDRDIAYGSFFHFLFWKKKNQLSAQEEATILNHEKAHILQGHSYDVLFLKIVKSFFWFHPIVWLIEKEILLVHEFLADAYASERSASKMDYTTLLIGQVLKSHHLTLVQSFSKSSLLRKRIAMLKNQTSSPWANLKIFMLLPFLALGMFIVACSENNEAIPMKFKTDIIKVDPAKQKPTSDQVDGESVYEIADYNANPIEGLTTYYNYLMENIHYPESAKKAGIEGKVYVRFVIKKDGSIGNVEVIKGISPELDAEAIRVISEGSHWRPGIKDGKPVNQRMAIPINFKLEG